MLDPRSRHPIGYSVRTGPVNASESIGLGKIALLGVGSSYPSGDDHLARVDEIAASVGLERILPLDTALPALTPRPVSITDVSRLFTVIPFGSDMSLMPPLLRALERSESDDTEDIPTAQDLA